MASPEVLDSSGMMDSVFSEELSAPAGWTKKLMPRKGGTPKRKDVVYVSPDGEEFKNKKQLDKYLKVHPGGPSSADFDWSTGETPRRSARLSSKGRLSSDGTDAEPISKRSRRSLDQRSPGSSTTPSRKGRKSQRLASNTAEDEVMQEAENEQDEAATVETTVPSGSTEDEGPKKEEKEGDKDSEMDAVKAPETEKDSKEITAVGKLESTGQVSDQLGSSEDTGNIGVKEAENEQDECATIGTTVPSGATEDEAPEKEGKKGDGDNEMDSVKAPETGNDSKDVTVVGEVESTGQFNDHLGSSEEPGNIAVKEPGRVKLQRNGRLKDEMQNKGSSNDRPGEGVDDRMRPRKSWNATDSSHVLAVKTALHLSAVPETVLCRETEQASVIDFCRMCIVEQRPGSIYVCGCPGTGKSLTMEKVRLLCNTWSAEAGALPPQIVALNCTSLTDPRHIYLKVVQALGAPHDGGETPGGVPKLKELRRLVCHTSEVRSLQKMLLLIVDEMDYLITRDQSVLYDLFRLPSLANSRCILVGIANAIDLTDRLLPKLRSLNCKVDVITFPAYTKDQILKVLQQRLQGLPYLVFKDAALELCARKVAAATGDMRKALHVCRSAVDIIQSELRDGNKDKDEAGKICAAQLFPAKQKLPEKNLGLVGLDTMALALSRIFRSPVVETIQALPRHQQMVLCAAVHRFRRAKKDATLGELHTAYVDFCKSTGMQTLTTPEFSSICQVLADQVSFNPTISVETAQSKLDKQLDEQICAWNIPLDQMLDALKDMLFPEMKLEK